MASDDGRIVPLRDATMAEAGGKALGLARLMALGLRVPDGFVIIGARVGALPDGLDAACEGLGDAKVAVRSSAIAEDREDASFAGQYETFLDRRGSESVRAAVVACLASTESQRAKAYAGRLADSDADPGMAVVVQRQVDARAAGVLFTVDPVSGDRDRVVVEAVHGLGEELVSGRATPDRFVLDRAGTLLESELKAEAPAVDAATLSAMVEEALRAEERSGFALDLEWALDEGGACWWLQARAITTLGRGGGDELETEVDPETLYTRYNIGEILPGTISPLTWFTCVTVVDMAFQEGLVAMGVLREVRPEPQVFAYVHNHAFMNLDTLYRAGAVVAGPTKESLDVGLSGRVLEETSLPPMAPAPTRLWNGLRFVRYVLGAHARVRRAQGTVESLRFRADLDPVEALKEVAASTGAGQEIVNAHFCITNLSTVLNDAILGMLGDGSPVPSVETKALAARLLAGADGVESAEVPAEMEGLAATLSKHEGWEGAAAAGDVGALLDWLLGAGSGSAGTAFRAFLDRHGHRGLMELELRQQDWAEDPEPLLHALVAIGGNPRREASAAEVPIDELLRNAGLPRWKIGMIRVLLPRAHRAIRAREACKSCVVLYLRRIRRVYLQVAEALVAAGRLPDTDLVFFLSPEEVQRLAREPAAELAEAARRRRRLFEGRRHLRFDPISVGRPAPVRPAPVDGGAGGSMTGTPVSRGVVQGPARVVRTLADARELQRGEILIVPFTDIGWTPYFAVAAGLATEIGGTLSHGAVVAREYGLPAVVNLPGATEVFRTGDMVLLDGGTGLVQRVRTSD
jgi:pyruvate,water dikinase